ncbi:MAG: efflux RND transporter permease subunit [Deltaproteobacteria bacterium]|nr:efflux RND transporter permease subunit [Deltaproteobacteria bacterium]
MNLAGLAIKRETTTWVVIALLLLGGAYAFLELGRLEDPEFTIKEAVVYTLYPGASPEEVEQEVTDPLEIAIQQMGQLKEIRSRSFRGLSIIQAEMKEKYGKKELPQIWDELRRKVNDAQAELPPGGGPSLVNDDFGDVYGIFFAVTGDGYSYAEIKEYVDFLRKELLLVEGVAKVAIFGAQDERIYVEMSPSKMSQLGIGPETIYAALNSRNLVNDSGEFQVDGAYLPLDLKGGFTSPEKLGDILLSGGSDGRLLRLGDVALLKRGYVEPPAQALRYQGKPALGLGISVVSGGNVVKLGEKVQERLQELAPRTPVGMEVNVITFQAALVEEAVNGFLWNLGEAVVIVIAVLMLFMGLQSGLIIGGVLILTIAGTFLAMYVWGIDLQRISLGALVLALGMLVDNAIVVTEGMLVRITRGMDGIAAADETVGQTAWPLLGATVVAILAFAALGLSNNAAGEFTYSLFQVMLISLLLSWVLAVMVTPLLCHRFLKVKGAGQDNDPYQGLLFRAYRPILRQGLHYRWLTVLAMAVLFAGSVFGFRFVEQSFFPPSTRSTFLVDYWLPEGTHIARTSQDLRQLEDFVKGLPGVTGVTTFLGQGGLRYTLTLAPEFPNTAYGQLMVEVENHEVINDLLPKVWSYAAERFPDSLCITSRFALGPGEPGKVRVAYTGDDPKVLRALAGQAVQVMEGNPRAKEVRIDWRQPARLLEPMVASLPAEAAGIDPAEIARTIHRFTQGRTVGGYREGDKLIPIVVRSPAADRQDLDDLYQQPIWSPAAGRMIPLRQVLSGVDPGWEDGIIRRKNRKRTLEVLCDPVAGTAEALRRQLAPGIEGIELPQGYSMAWTGEYKDSKEANASVFAGVPLAFLGMVLIVVVLFDAFRQPLIIFLCLPLAMIGVTAGLLLTGLPLSFMAVLGILSLSGMLIKNAVVLIDQIDLDIAAGKPTLRAIKDASISRLRPVLMAAITTVLGMAPLIIDPFYQSMAVTIMFGLTFATLLTLLVVPVLYALFFRAGHT